LVFIDRPGAFDPYRLPRANRENDGALPGDRGMAAILASFMTSLEDHGAECTPEELHHLGTVAADLATACLAQHLDADDRLPAEVRTRTDRLVQLIPLLDELAAISGSFLPLQPSPTA
jgi:hypothetical protein